MEPLDKILFLSRRLWKVTLIGMSFHMLLLAGLGYWGHGVGSSTSIWFWLPAVAVVVLMPLAFFIRNQIYKANWQGNTVSPKGYLRAIRRKNLIQSFVPISTGVALTMQGVTWTALVAGLLWLCIHLADYPTGKPMRPTPPRLGIPRRQ